MEPRSLEETTKMKSDGDLDARIEFAKEIGNHAADPVRLRMALSKTARAHLKSKGATDAELDELAPLYTPPPAWRGMPTTGAVKIFALLIDFPDQPHTATPASFNDALFGAPAVGAPYNSLKEYYRRASYGLLDLGGATLGWYRASRNRSQIPQTRAGREALIKEAINHFKAQGHDFSQYDNDGDGVIDYFLVFWTGADTGWGTFWWGYMTGFADAAYTVDGKRLGTYSWQWESRPVGSGFKPRVAIHETGHALGLPDLYDYDDRVGPDGGVGGADMMDHNLFDHNCFSKWMLGWVDPLIIGSGSQNVTLAPSGNTQQCVAVWPALATSGMFSELFMVQNRHPVENDAEMPATGLMIWHIDASLNAAGQDFQFDNSYTAHKYVRLMEADGREDIEASRSFDVGDLYVPGKTLGPATTPSSATYSGAAATVSVTNIAVAGASISATIQATALTPRINVVPTRVDFGWVRVGTIRRRKVTIANTGGAPLKCKLSMCASTVFTLDTTGCGAAPVVPPGGRVAFTVVYRPRFAFGSAQTVIQIASNDPAQPLVNVLVRGVGMPLVADEPGEGLPAAEAAQVTA